jgi:predicted AlkP superfamily pyrophosphatase or phosphodiesterase
MVSSLAPPTVPEPLVPDYAGACLSNVVPAVLEPPHTRPEWFPTAAWGADQVVLLTLDGLGWDQLQDRRALVPSTASLEGGPILTVAPSTTATALSSLCLGAPPGEHGVVGYRINVRGDVLNVLRWQTPHGDARTVIPPDAIQNRPAFCGKRPTVVTRAEFAGTGFTAAHLSNVRFRGYRVPSTMVTEVDHALRRGERFVYAYYDGIDKVAHEYGLGDFYDAELVAVDRIIADLVSVLPADAVLMVTSDHGQVDVGEAVVPIHDEVIDHVELLSGEGRFRWLHARPGQEDGLRDAAVVHHGARAWVRTRQQVIEDGWFGPKVSEASAARFGDVVIAAIDPVAFEDPADTGPYRLQARHGSLTGAEMRVPLLAVRA